LIENFLVLIFFGANKLSLDLLIIFEFVRLIILIFLSYNLFMWEFHSPATLIIYGVYLFFEYALIEYADLITASTVATEEINADQQ